jgi:hypothetical protein
LPETRRRFQASLDYLSPIAFEQQFYQRKYTKQLISMLSAIADLSV